MELYETLKEAYETTTHSVNRFKEAIENINWDNQFKADGEHYFVKGNFTLTVENLDPFAEQWKPTAYFADGGVLEF